MSVCEKFAGWLDPCFELAWQGLSDIEWVRENRPKEFRSYAYRSGNGDFQLTSDGWLERGRRLNLRWTRLQGRNLDIATLMCYPTNRPDLLPVFAFEWVMVGGRGHAMICDVEVCGPQAELTETLQRLFREPGQQYQELFARRESPDWFTEISQPHAQLFTASVDELDSVFQLQQAYLTLTVEHFYRPVLASLLSGGPDHPKVREYKHHHAENSPGGKMLEKWFGEEKAKEFLYNYHFGPGGV